MITVSVEAENQLCEEFGVGITSITIVTPTKCFVETLSVHNALQRLLASLTFNVVLACRLINVVIFVILS